MNTEVRVPLRGSIHAMPHGMAQISYKHATRTSLPNSCFYSGNGENQRLRSPSIQLDQSARKTELISLALNSSIILQNWKVGRLFPLLKPGKSKDQAKSYRPIALFTLVAKLSEIILLDDFKKSH